MSSTSTSAEATLDALADPVLVCGVDGRLSFVNAAAARLLDEPVSALVGRPAQSIVPPRIQAIDGQRFVEWLVGAWEQHRRPIRVPVVRHDGVEIHQAVQVTTTGVEGLGTVVVLPDEALELDEDPLDVATRHPSAERSYRALFESVPVGVIHFDAAGRITAINELLAEQLGSTRSVVVGLDMRTLPNEQLRAALEEALAGRVGEFDGEYTSVTGNRTRLFRATLSPILRDGRVEGGVGIVDDVTDRREIEVRLAQGERMASLGRLAAGVAHEINNPLAYVRTNLDLARRELEGLRGADAATIDRALHALLRADDGVERVRVIASDLKTFSRGDDGSWQPVQMRRVVDAAINLAWNEIRHRAELVREIGPASPVMGSETRFVQVLVNLLVNAAQAIEDEGDPSRRRITVRLGETDDDHVFLEVEDTGHGIEPDLVGRIFEPFWTSKPKTRGTGLGLSICHGIVTSAGGTIQVKSSEIGVGTTFRVELPGVAATTPAKRRTEGSTTAPPARRGRVLVVDDEPRLSTTLRLALSDGADVEVADGGAAALSILEQEGAAFDLVLCDLMMPDVSGMEVYERIQARRPDLAARFVFMTGGAFTDRARDFLKTSGMPRIEKPFALADVERILAERLAT
ncbi:MAG: PAS domain-containing protein [Myxococcales bacterium]|nr:PAS domain-containing protein [Myxococcales bacterium]